VTPALTSRLDLKGRADLEAVLAVDDDPKVTAALVRLLRPDGVRVLAATSGEEALRLLDEHAASIGVVVSDFAMPGMTGADLLRDVRLRWPEITRVLLSGKADLAGAARAVNEGHLFRLYTQPVQPNEFRAGIMQALEQHRLVCENRRLRVQTEEQAAQLEQWNQELEVLVAERTAELEYQGLHDRLTDLPNRRLLHERLRQTIAAGRRDGTPTALLILDVDRFKDVNDTFGHQGGDVLLQQASRRLQNVLRETDTLARLDGDEFAALLPATDTAGATVVAQKLLRALEQSLSLDGHRVEVCVSIGVATCPEHGEDADTLLRSADVAMYVAKRRHSGLATYAFEEDQHSLARLALLGELRTALEHDELLLHYQPQVAMASGAAVGVEALVRWGHPRHGLILPGRFIPLAEQSGLIQPLTRWVIDAALRQCRAWHEAGLQIPVWVNLSMRNLQDPHLAELIAERLAAWEVAPGSLRVEVTESGLMAEPARARTTLRRLRALGLRSAIDDFGTGYSSLSYLKRLPIDELKIDKSFVRQMARDAKDAAIVRSTVRLSHDLGLTVVAEGVENAATWELLGNLGCDVGQGYYLTRPLPAAELARWLTRWAAT
jgi:diguanylate cyclase (GGDEF)-like protein